MRRFLFILGGLLLGLTVVDFLMSPAVIGERLRWLSDPENKGVVYRTLIIRSITAAVITFILNRFDK
jgi:hypothetical protein